jgi:hypothetical protein
MQAEIGRIFDYKPNAYTEEHFRLFYEFKDALNQGRIRAAQPDLSAPSGWRVNGWVKKGILLGFRMGGVVDLPLTVPKGFFFGWRTGDITRPIALSLGADRRYELLDRAERQQRSDQLSVLRLR